MSTKVIRKLLMVFTVFFMISTVSTPVHAQDSVSCSGTFYTSPTKRNEQVRFITVVRDPVWTSLKTVEGQPTRGAYVKKGDALYYGSSSGTDTPVSLTIGLGATYGYGSASVSLSVPLGKAASSSAYGKVLTADQSGYYLIKAKKQIRPIVVFAQFRSRDNFNQYSDTGEWGPWGKAKYYSKRYETVRTYSTLVKQ